MLPGHVVGVEGGGGVVDGVAVENVGEYLERDVR